MDSVDEDFTQQIADQVESFLVALQAISREESSSTAFPLLLLEVSQILLAGARLGAQTDFVPDDEFQPDVGPDPDLDQMRERLAVLLGDLDTYAHNFEPYDPNTITASISDDLTSIATDLANGLKHFRQGHLVEALWWWQYSYLSNWGSSACGVVSALHSVIAHSRLDADADEAEVLEAADEILDEA